MKKKILSAILVLCLLLTIVPSAFAHTDVTPSSEAEGVVAYPAQDGNIYFNTETGIIMACDESVTAIHIPAEINGVAVQGVGEYLFSYHEKLSYISVDEDNEYLSSDDTGILFNKDKTTLIVAAPKTISGVYAIPDSVKTIESGAFMNCAYMKNVTIPDGVEHIGYAAFSGCSRLTSVTIPDSVTTIRDYAFGLCSNLKIARLGSGVTSIGQGVFSDCTSLIYVSIPDTVTKIDAFAFKNCDSLTSVILPASVKEIGMEAFEGCEKLANVYFLGNAPLLEPDCENTVFATLCDIDDELTYVLNEDLSLYYIEGKSGWTAPTWFGYPTAAWAPFSDMTTEKWYDDAVNFAVCFGLMNGMGKNEFRPDEAMTRSMLVTVLWRYAGSPSEGESTFTDLTQDWYRQAVAWAAKKGIVNGYPDGTFRPDDKLTREQLATILYRYCGTIGIGTAYGYDLSVFPDYKTVSPYAEKALSWATAVGLVNGITHGGSLTKYLEPQGSATCAQVATILMRFIENVAE